MGTATWDVTVKNPLGYTVEDTNYYKQMRSDMKIYSSGIVIALDIHIMYMRSKWMSDRMAIKKSLLGQKYIDIVLK